MATEKMLSRVEDDIGYITFNNPEKHNAVSIEMWDALENILDDFKENQNIRVIVLNGAGGKSFVSGADISKFDKERSSSSKNLTFPLPELFRRTFVLNVFFTRKLYLR